MPELGTLSLNQELPSGGTQILNGVVPPTEAVGAVGDVYLDMVAKIMYGPKAASSLGPDETAIDPATGPPQFPNANGNYTLGFRVQFLVPGIVSALRFYRASSAATTSRTLTLYRAGVSVATVNSSGETGSGWKTIPLATPVPVDTGVVYITAYRVSSDYFAETDVAGVPPNYSANISNLGGCYGSSSTFPASNNNFNYHADLVFNAGALAWPSVIKSA